MIFKNNIKLLTLLLLLAAAGALRAQDAIHFEYDASGNRVKRFMVAEAEARVAVLDEAPEADSLLRDELQEVVDLVYPNPTEGLLRFTIQGAEAPLSQVNIFDLNGRIIFSKTFKVPDFEVDLTIKPLGVYIVRWAFLDHTRTIKIIKQ